MGKQLQLHEQSKTIFWAEAGASKKSIIISKMWDKKVIYFHVPKANLILEKPINFQVNIIRLSKVMIFF